MKRMLTARAPGKVVLLGEYAVLHGAPGLVMAVDRFAETTICTHPGHVCVSSGHKTSPDIFSELDPYFGFVRRVIEASAPDLHDAAITVDTSAFSDLKTGIKLGIGSSAALMVATAKAVEEYVGALVREKKSDCCGSSVGAVREPPVFSWRQLIALHQAEQNHRGSGMDVVASYFGGIRSVQWHGDDVTISDDLAWPQNLHAVYIWPQESSNTATRLEKFHWACSENPKQMMPVVRDLCALAEEGLAAWAEGDINRFISIVDSYSSMLCRLGDLMDLPMLTPGHARARKLAHYCGGVYKPSGAGGGDLGMAWFADRDACDKFRILIAQENHLVDLDLHKAQAGVSVVAGA